MNKDSELLQLKNLGVASVNILNAIGIQNREDLAQIGSVAAFLKIKARGIKVSKVMLYALEGALLDIHWKDLEPGLKQQLLDQAAAGESAQTAPL